MLGNIIRALSTLESSIVELDTLLKKGYIAENKKEEFINILESRKDSRMMLRRTLLALGGPEYLLPYWSM